MTDKLEEKRLEQLGASTDDLRPDDALDDAVLLAAAADATRLLDAGPGLDDQVLAAVALESLAQRTSALEPSGGFTDAVMRQLQIEAPASSGAWPTFLRSGRAALVAAAAVAAGLVSYAGYVESMFDDDIMANVDSVEVGE
ncbi:MAG: hypothetical protein JNL21_06735 [Myxococcales bacterium]|nr:hypothetical protein [Myxococcales bacterium]